MFLSCLLAGFLSAAEAQQPGCTDPGALNYDPSATLNDGSCQYAPVNYTPVFVTFLEPTVKETSGLAFHNGLLWTQNDSGNPSRLYAVDTLTGEVLRSVFVTGAPNIDWEELAVSPTHLFVGDFGNNGGNRKDLRIFRIPLDSLAVRDTVSADTIAFLYEDQTDFTTASNSNDYDCEAFLWMDDSLHLFTKNWLSQNTRHYVLPSQPGQHAASLRDSLDTGGLITGAARDSSGNGIVLCGYVNQGFGFWTCFAWLLWDNSPHAPFSGNKRRIELGTALQLGQMEAVALRPDGTGWLTGEAVGAGPFSFEARLSRFDLSPYFGLTSAIQNGASGAKTAIRVWPNPTDGLLNAEIHPALYGSAWRLVDSTGRDARLGIFPAGRMTLDTAGLAPGTYWLIALPAGVEPVMVQIR